MVLTVYIFLCFKPGRTRSNLDTRQRKKQPATSLPAQNGVNSAVSEKSADSASKSASWRRILLLIIAITVHNIPGNSRADFRGVVLGV